MADRRDSLAAFQSPPLRPRAFWPFDGWYIPRQPLRNRRSLSSAVAPRLRARSRFE